VAVWSAGLLAVALCVAGCGPQQDVALARRVLILLVEGLYTARNLIDWEKFVAIGVPVGQQWSAYTGAQDRLSFQRSFIDAFHSGFLTEKGDTKSFINWRVMEATDKPVRMTRVAVDIKGKPLFLFLDIAHEKGKRKLVRIEAVKIVDEKAFQEAERKLRRDW
jgi:hypothetical protein